MAKCLNCSKNFKKRTYRHKYCCLTCNNEAQSLMNRGVYELFKLTEQQRKRRLRLLKHYGK